MFWTKDVHLKYVLCTPSVAGEDFSRLIKIYALWGITVTCFAPLLPHPPPEGAGGDLSNFMYWYYRTAGKFGEIAKTCRPYNKFGHFEMQLYGVRRRAHCTESNCYFKCQQRTSVKSEHLC